MNKAEHFELWCWRRLLRVPWITRRSNQSILKEICPGCSLEGLMLKLKLQYFGHLMQRVDSLEKTWWWEGLGAVGEGDDRMTWLDGITHKMGMSLSKLRVYSSLSWTGRPGVLWFMELQRTGHDWVTKLKGGLACCGSWGHKDSDAT